MIQINLDEALERALFRAVERVIVDKFKVTALGLADAVTDAVVAALASRPAPVVEAVRSRSDEYVREEIAKRRGMKPVAPPTEEWEDPEPYTDRPNGLGKRHADDPRSTRYHRPRTREQYEADQRLLNLRSIFAEPVAAPVEETPHESAKRRVREALDDLLSAPVVPVDALGFPTQEGATFTATVVLGERRTLRLRVVDPGGFRALDEPGAWHRGDLDRTSIEDVRPAGAHRSSND